MLFLQAVGLRFMFPNIVLFSKNSNKSLVNEICKATGVAETNVCLFTGTQGLTRRLTLQMHNDEGVYFYAKISTNSFSAERIVLETNVLKKLSTFQFIKIQHPQIIASGKTDDRLWFVQSSFTSQGYKHPSSFSEVNVSFLNEMSNNSSGKTILKNHFVYENIWTHFSNSGVKDSEKIMEILTLFKDKQYSTVHSHGDFTSWNIRIKNDQLFIFDWEAFTENNLPLFDLFHYFVQDGILIKRQSVETIYDEIHEAISKHTELFFNGTKKDVDLLLLMYILNIRIEYGKLLEEEDPGFIQVEWQEKVRREFISYLIIKFTLSVA